MLTKLSQNSQKTSESYKTLENAFDKNHEQLFFEKFSVSFLTVFGQFSENLKINRKSSENDYGLIS